MATTLLAACAASTPAPQQDPTPDPAPVSFEVQTVPDPRYCAAGELPLGTYDMFAVAGTGIHGDASFGSGELAPDVRLAFTWREPSSGTLVAPTEVLAGEWVIEPGFDAAARLQTVEGFAV